MLVGREALAAARVGQRLALGNADTRFVRLVIIGTEELHRVRRHHRQAQRSSQRHGGAHMGFMLRLPGALQLDVEAPREEPRELFRDELRARRVAGQQRHADRTQVGAGKRDQAATQFLQPLPLHPGLRALRIAHPGAREQLAHVQPAGLVLHQQLQAARRLVAGVGPGRERHRLHPDIGADHRLHALRTAGLVELDCAEEVVEVGQRQRRHAIGPRGRRGIVDAQRAVDDGIFAVQTQVNEAGSAGNWVRCREIGHGGDSRQRGRCARAVHGP